VPITDCEKIESRGVIAGTAHARARYVLRPRCRTIAVCPRARRLRREHLWHWLLLEVITSLFLRRSVGTNCLRKTRSRTASLRSPARIRMRGNLLIRRNLFSWSGFFGPSGKCVRNKEAPALYEFANRGVLRRIGRPPDPSDFFSTRFSRALELLLDCSHYRQGWALGGVRVARGWD